MTVLRTDSNNKDFIDLVKLLDADLAKRDGEEHDFYNQYNSIDHLSHVIVLYKDDNAIGCGALKEYDPSSMEIKRMFTSPSSRKSGIATIILAELEKWALELEYDSTVLETGKRQPEAIQLYKKNGYQQIDNYGQYKGIENSICFEKVLV